MHYSSLIKLTADRNRVLSTGPIALILVEDATAIDSTLAHHAKCGFAQIFLFCPVDIQLPDLPENVHRVDDDVMRDDALTDIVNTVAQAAPGLWIYYGYNAEYLYYPFIETRNLTELIGFATEERRNAIFCSVVDLYAGDLTAAPDGVAVDDAFFDRTGYYAEPRVTADLEPLDRQINIYGGLRWRFEEFVPEDRRRIDRVCLFRAQPDVLLLPDRTFTEPEYNTYSCPWHNNVTISVCSFRTAKALRRNPGSRHAIASFRGPNSETFQWHSQQLMDFGLMEPGQWF